MKANEAPEKIYLSMHPVTGVLHVKLLKGNDTIEYTCTDALIEKVCAFLKDRIEHDSIDYPMATMHLIEDLKQYIYGNNKS